MAHFLEGASEQVSSFYLPAYPSNYFIYDATLCYRVTASSVAILELKDGFERK